MRRGRRDPRHQDDPAVWRRPESGRGREDGDDTASEAALNGDDSGTPFENPANDGATPAFMGSKSGRGPANASTAALGGDGRPSTTNSFSSNTDEEPPRSYQQLPSEVMRGMVPVGPPSASSTSDDEDLTPYVLPEDDLGTVSDNKDTARPSSMASVSGSASPATTGSLQFVPQCTTIFRRVEDLYGLLLLRGPRGLREDQYHMVREGFNISSSVALPSLSYVRETLTTRVSP